MIKIGIEEVESIVAKYLYKMGCRFDREYETEGRSKFVRFQDNEQEDNEYSFIAHIIMPVKVSYEIEESSDGS